MATATLVRFELGENGFDPVAECYSVPEPSFSHAAYLSRLHELNQTFRIIDTPSGASLEVGIVNSHKLSEDAVLMASTSFSSLTQNVGNAIELAAHGAADPDVARIYVAYPGNGGSEGLGAAGQWRILTRGRFTAGPDGELSYKPTKAMERIARTLTAHELVPNHLTGDVEGARLALGVAAALDANTIKDGYLNNLAGVSPGGYALPMVGVDIQDRIAAKLTTSAEYGPTNEERQAEARQALASIYGRDDHRKLLRVRWAHMVPNLGATSIGFGRHKNLARPDSHAVLQDVLAVMLRHEMKLMLGFNIKDGADQEQVAGAYAAFGKLVLDHLTPDRVNDRRNLNLLIGRGNRDYHTLHPSYRWGVERQALSSIIRQLVNIPGGRHDQPGPALGNVAWQLKRQSS